jgi:GTPase SAR1 family protein
LQLWDSAGQERFTSLATNYLRNADCAVIVLDVSIELPGTNLEEEATVYVENELTKWMDLFNQSTQVKSFAFVVGNKIDKT